jgi:hypothetical protein
MTTGSGSDAFEARLRATLIDLRPGEGAPASLRGRIDAVPEQLGGNGLRSRIRGLLASPLAAATTVAAISLGLLVAYGRPVPGPATTGGVNPTPAVFDPAVEGPGIVHDPIPTLPIAAGIVVVLGLVLALRWRSRMGFETFRDLGRGLVVIALVALPGWLALQPTLADPGGSCCTAFGYGWPVYPAPGLDGPEAYYETAAPGGPIVAFIDVTNTSPVPVTLEGLVDNAYIANVTASGEIHPPRWTSLALPSVPNTFPNSIEQLRTFSPSVIAPNDRLTVYLVGKAGACAFGPTFDVSTSATDGYITMSRDLTLAYSMFGLSWTKSFRMQMQLVEPTAANCP